MVEEMACIEIQYNMLKYNRTAKIFGKGGGIDNCYREQMTSNSVIVSSLFFLIPYFDI